MLATESKFCSSSVVRRIGGPKRAASPPSSGQAKKLQRQTTAHAPLAKASARAPRLDRRWPGGASMDCSQGLSCGVRSHSGDLSKHALRMVPSGFATPSKCAELLWQAPQPFRTRVGEVPIAATFCGHPASGSQCAGYRSGLWSGSFLRALPRIGIETARARWPLCSLRGRPLHHSNER